MGLAKTPVGFGKCGAGDKFWTYLYFLKVLQLSCVFVFTVKPHFKIL